MFGCEASSSGDGDAIFASTSNEEHLNNVPATCKNNDNEIREVMEPAVVVGKAYSSSRRRIAAGIGWNGISETTPLEVDSSSASCVNNKNSNATRSKCPSSSMKCDKGSTNISNGTTPTTTSCCGPSTSSCCPSHSNLSDVDTPTNAVIGKNYATFPRNCHPQHQHQQQQQQCINHRINTNTNFNYNHKKQQNNVHLPYQESWWVFISQQLLFFVLPTTTKTLRKSIPPTPATFCHCSSLQSSGLYSGTNANHYGYGSTANYKSRTLSVSSVADHRRHNHYNNCDGCMFCTPTAPRRFLTSWKVISLAIVCLAFMFRWNATNEDPNQTYYTVPECRWDHNVYIPLPVTPPNDDNSKTSTTEDKTNTNGHKKSAATDSNASAVTTMDNQEEESPSPPRRLLLAQLTGYSALRDLADISARPNRAYALQWTMDYLRYSRGSSSSPFHEQSCFDQVYLLHEILNQEQQQQSSSALLSSSPKTSKSSSSTSYFTTQAPHVRYDAILFLQPDSIITNLDFHLLKLIPNDKIIAVAGWKNNKEDNAPIPTTANAKITSNTIHTKTDILFFNLNHKYSMTVANIWLELIQSDSRMTCGDGNHLGLLLQAMSMAVAQNEVAINDDDDNNELEQLSDIIYPLMEDDKGFLGFDSRGITDSTVSNTDDSYYNNFTPVIKGILPVLPEPRSTMLMSNLEQVKTSLHTVADSVCYRYYPKCDVL